MVLDETPLQSDAPRATSRQPATKRGQATMRRLLAAAEVEFGEKGFHAASVSGMTSGAGVGQGTFYLYFDSKESIFRALVVDVSRGVRRAMAAAVSGVAGDRMVAERRGLEAFVQYVFDHPHLYRIIQESQFVDEQMFRAYYTDLARGYSAALHGATERGELRPGDAEARAWAIMGIGHFLGLRFAVWQGQEVPSSVMDQVMDLVAHGMAPA